MTKLTGLKPAEKKKLIVKTISQTGSVEAAADVLSCNRTWLYRVMQQLGITPPGTREAT